MSAELSGRMDSLESQMTYLTQDLLQKLDLNGAGSLSTVWNQQFDELDTLVSNIKNQVQILQNLYSNLYMTVRTNYIILTGHTGAASLHD